MKNIVAALSLGVVSALIVIAQPQPSPAVEAAAASPGDLRVASFNVQSVSVDKTIGNRRPWRLRRAAVVADIIGERPDVIGVQEANPSRFFAPRLVDGATQFLDLRRGLNQAGGNYQLTNTVSFNCVRPTTNYKCVHRYHGASWADRILYNRDTITLVSQGSNKYRVQGPGADERYIVWAVMRLRATGRAFLFVSTHLRGGTGYPERSQWNQLIARVNQAKRGRPVIVVGDFNLQKFAPLAAHYLPAMRSAGYGDVLNQQYAVNPVANPRIQSPDSIVNGWVNTWNRLDRDMTSSSYSTRRDKTGNMIDWIFATNSLPVKDFKVVIDYDPTTLRVRGVFPSDHNMIRATVTLP